ncbi:hypothetical protein OF829_01445 [Sphingomonas sp. LB-2]|uniref:hypothetical protein n=1 Tax=Sphingomonas caeni TaxID=2984949 RepID=UPI00223190B4|nr:hypothetical protein [Sphingomonas caeni]MCW3845887.1 hypothetical protein [Sphingomonas caeni]
MGHFLPFRLVTGVLVLIWIAALLGTARPIVLMSSPTIDYIGEAKVPPEVGDMTKLLDDYGVHTPRPHTKFEIMLAAANTVLGHPPRADTWEEMTKIKATPAVGNAVREWSFLGLPFGWVSEEDPAVMFVRNDWGIVYTGLKPGAWEMVNKANGRDVTKAALYPFWTHTWGWLMVLGGLFAGWLWNRGNARRREELGLID